jgi:NADPH-dependent 2,4-dienoyl-CoA reductase/sulfur reductase-like enzyme
MGPDGVATRLRPGAEVAAVGMTSTRCAIVGGGPAGMMLGLLLARAGVPVTVLEKHPEFCATSAATPCTPRP